MSKEIKLVDLTVSDNLKKDGFHTWQDCIIKCISDIVDNEDYLYVAEVDFDNYSSFNNLCINLGKIFRSKGVSNIIFVPRGTVSFKRVEIINS